MIYPRLPARFHAAHFIQRDAEPHLDMTVLWKWPTTPPTREFPNALVDGRDLIMVGALASQHPLLSILINQIEGDIHKTVARRRLALPQIRPYVAARDSYEWVIELLFQPC
jgi:hypothetical protein